LNTPPILTLKNISKYYQTPAQKIEVLANINLTITTGESIAIVGQSGCGKSTLLNIMGTLDQSTSGTIQINQQTINNLNPNQLAKLRNQQIGFIFQQHHLLPQCTVLENILIPTLPHNKTNYPQNLQRAKYLLQKVGLHDRLNHPANKLSGGEAQRVAIVRSLINTPSILLADEPTGALDNHTGNKLANLLLLLKQTENLTIILVTHNENLATKMDKILYLNQTKLSPNKPK